MSGIMCVSEDVAWVAVLDMRRVIHAAFVLIFIALIALFGVRPILKWYFPLAFRDTVNVYAEQYQLDPLLVTAVMRVESEFDPEAVSPKGARGLMQIMPETAIWAAEQMGMKSFDPDLLFDPDTNISIGVWYLALLKNQFDGDEVLALAAYNGGRTNVLRWLNDNVWAGTKETVEQIPFPETRGYVRRVLHTYDWYMRVWAGGQPSAN